MKGSGLINQKVAEECWFARKYLRGRIHALNISMDSLTPNYPGAVLKITGIPMHSDVLKTSSTEYWGILRAECEDAMELQAKMHLLQVISDVHAGLSTIERKFVSYRYEKEYPDNVVMARLRCGDRTYYRIKERVLKKTIRELRNHNICLDRALF